MYSLAFVLPGSENLYNNLDLRPSPRIFRSSRIILAQVLVCHVLSKLSCEGSSVSFDVTNLLCCCTSCSPKFQIAHKSLCWTDVDSATAFSCFLEVPLPGKGRSGGGGAHGTISSTVLRPTSILKQFEKNRTYV